MLADDFVGFISLDPLRAGIPSGHLAIGIEHENGVCPDTFQNKAALHLGGVQFGVALGQFRRTLQNQALQTGVHVVQLYFGQFTLGDVAVCFDDVSALCLADQHHACLGDDLVAISAGVAQFTFPAALALQNHKETFHATRFAGVQQIMTDPPDRFFPAKPVEAFGTPIPERNRAVPLPNMRRIVGLIDQLGIMLQSRGIQFRASTRALQGAGQQRDPQPSKDEKAQAHLLFQAG